MNPLTVKLFACEYDYQNRVWTTVVEAYDRDSAMTQFRRDNPTLELRSCYQVGRQSSSNAGGEGRDAAEHYPQTHGSELIHK